MDPYIYLVIAEILIIGLIFILKYIINKQEHKKIDKILKFLQKNNNTKTKDKIEECIKVINNKEDK